ncbi:ARL14 effector protein isoform X2 [Trichoplusia ni]|uniref:ARL14 effector protein isoform X2 n=2 Tax=Plusiinae TaxID=95186 RepID=A0A7E5WDS5_TRINI|nr:ARL14 effector protein isoform X2 [Trichoplusia ni]XP_026738830.1 ARL14 effector protein isoform X2 [Trichoplusia ni]
MLNVKGNFVNIMQKNHTCIEHFNIKRAFAPNAACLLKDGTSPDAILHEKYHKMNFLDNFDPETSARERRKLNRKSYFMKRKSKNIYNERGLITVTGKDLCDCLDETCPGCHFPCSKCNSNKCGLECRVNRKWMYDKIEIEGNDFVVKNDYKHK